MKHLLYFLFLLSVLIEHFHCYTCPVLSCAEPIGSDICFLHPGESPVKGEIRTFGCPSDHWCYLKQENYRENYAWVKSYKQNIKNSDYLSDSVINYKYTERRCEHVSTFQQ